MDQLDELRTQYPTHPLWALKSLEHLRARLGAYDDAVAAGRGILARAAGGDSNFTGAWVPAMTRLEMGHALVADLRPAEARPFLLAVAKDGIPGNVAAAPRARFLLGRSLEMEGDREGALAHYRIAASGADQEWRARARAAIRTPLPAARVRALAALGEARRRRDAKRGDEAIRFAREALDHWPESMEAALAVAGERLEAGDVAGARRAWPRADARQLAETPWLRPWEWILAARRDDLEGRREEAVQQYKKVLQERLRRPELEEAAEAGIKRVFRPSGPESRGRAPGRISTAVSTT
jgi:tetratricopeptide (TPR) repeat protein